MSTIEELRAEVETLKSKIEKQDKELKEKDEKIHSLEKTNNWYIEQMKLKAKEKFGTSSKKVASDLYSYRSYDKNGESGFIKQAKHPKALIPTSIVSLQSLAYIINQKYTIAVTLYKQDQEFKRLCF